MKMDFSEHPRLFRVGINKQTEIHDFGKLFLESNEMITFVNESKKKYDFVSKDWGYYATPSINGRLKNEGFRTALVKNDQGRFYIMVVDTLRLESFYSYLEEDNQKIIEWLDERI